MLVKKVIHVVPHSHWDREWYMSFEHHRYYLIKLIDSVIEKMENDAEYRYYHLDGQMIILEDYLRIKPYMYDRLKRLITDGRIQVGPWYVLQDEYLTSDEANVRNMLIGYKTATDYGVEPLKIGYLPDSFGNIAQMPQILKKLGIDSVVFGRGVTAMSEIIWSSEDGSSVIGGHFAPWYNNAAELPTNHVEAALRIEKMMNNFTLASKINDYLGMNGSDHQPVQKNLTEALKAMNEQSDENITFIHSNIKDYMDILKEKTDLYPVIASEMAGQNTNGHNLLISTASSRIYLKQKNCAAQNALERLSEPISSLAYMFGAEYPDDFMLYAWKKLLENHAHDSICGCGVDEIHRDMITRFDNTMQVADSITKDMMSFFEKKIRTDKSKGYPVIVFNSAVYERTDEISVQVDIPNDILLCHPVLKDENGNAVECSIIQNPNTFTYDLPEDSFRKVTYKNRLNLNFIADRVPSMGYCVYYISSGEENKLTPMVHSENSAENQFIILKINTDGSLRITDKVTGEIFDNLNIYEDYADIGDEYMFAGGDDIPLTTAGTKAEISLLEVTSNKASFLVKNTIQLTEKGKTVPLNIKTQITITKHSRGVKIRTNIFNSSGCHRLRALFKNDIKTDKVLASGQFDVLARNIATVDIWKKATNEQRMQAFAALRDNRKTLLVATRALHEYEVLRDGSNTLCINLLRCVDRMGDWGDFPTPEAQCIGENMAEYEIFAGDSGSYQKSMEQGLMFSSGEMYASQIMGSDTGLLPEAKSFLRLEGAEIWSTAFKKQENGNGLVLRVYSGSSKENNAEIFADHMFKTAYESNLAEEISGENLLHNNKITLHFAPKEIKTIIFNF